MPPSPSQLSWVEPIIQLVTAGGFGALAWYLVVKHIPKMEQRHREERKELVEALEKKDAQHDDNLEMFNKTVQRSIEVQSTMNGRLDGLEKSIQQIPQLIREHTR